MLTGISTKFAPHTDCRFVESNDKLRITAVGYSLGSPTAFDYTNYCHCQETLGQAKSDTIISLLKPCNTLDRTFLICLAFVGLFSPVGLYAQCSINDVSVNRNAAGDGITVSGTAVGCTSVSAGFSTPSTLPTKSASVAANGTFNIDFGPNDGVTAAMMQDNFACDGRNFNGVVVCARNKECKHDIAGNVHCQVCPTISLSVQPAPSGNPPCLQPGTVNVTVNGQAPTDGNADWHWFVDSNFQESVVDPSGGLSVTVASGQQRIVSLSATIGTCLYDVSILLQGCGPAPTPTPTPRPRVTATPTPTPTSSTTSTATPTPTPTPLGPQEQSAFDICLIWMIANLILIILTLVLFVWAFCPPNQVTIIVAVGLALLTLASIILWMIFCSNWMNGDQHFCDLFKWFMFILGIIGLSVVAALVLVATQIVEASCALVGLTIALGYVGTLYIILSWIDAAVFHCPLTPFG